MLKVNVSHVFLYIIGALLTIPLLEFKGITWGTWLLLPFSFIMLIKKEKVRVCIPLISLSCVGLITVFLSILSNMGTGWKKTSILQSMLFFSAVVFGHIINEKGQDSTLKYLSNGIVHGCILNIIWGYFQVVSYSVFNIDLNTAFFSGTFGRTEVTALRNGDMCLSGFGWHPAQMIPIILLLFLLTDNVFFHALILFAAVLTYNSTCLFAVLLCFGMSLFFSRKVSKEKNNIKKTIIAIIGSALGIILLLKFPDVRESLFGSVSRLYERIHNAHSGTAKDFSTQAHMRYYTALPDIMKQENILIIIFGNGFNCSGYPFSMMFGQYIQYKTWVTESDIVNFLLGNGLVWTIIFYGWIISIGIRGYRLSYKYLVFVVCLVSCGVMYNIQYYWVLIFEIAMEYSLKCEYNIFDYNVQTNKGNLLLYSKKGAKM